MMRAGKELGKSRCLASRAINRLKPFEEEHLPSFLPEFYRAREALINGHFEGNEKFKLLILKIPHTIRNDKSE
jgi:hypothetical protein